MRLSYSVNPACFRRCVVILKIIIMTKVKWLIGLFASLVIINTANFKIPKGEVAGTELIQFKSTINNQDTNCILNYHLLR